MLSNESKFIFAYLHDGVYAPETVYGSVKVALDNTEYDDVRRGEYQIWEYPSGKIFKVEPDREVTNERYRWSPPATNLWQPRLIQIAVDEKKVAEAYTRLTVTRRHTSLVKRLKGLLGH